jgi:hypothetical protein
MYPPEKFQTDAIPYNEKMIRVVQVRFRIKTEGSCNLSVKDIRKIAFTRAIEIASGGFIGKLATTIQAQLFLCTPMQGKSKQSTYYYW